MSIRIYALLSPPWVVEKSLLAQSSSLMMANYTSDCLHCFESHSSSLVERRGSKSRMVGMKGHS
jgi:hypothetical protein